MKKYLLALLFFCFIAQCFAQVTFQKVIRRNGGAIGCGGYFVQQTNDNGYIICGETRGGNYSDIFLIKTNSGGDTLWTKNYGGSDDEYAYCVKQTRDGGYIIAGYTYSFGAVNGKAYIIKTDSSGNVSWSKMYGGS